MIRNVVLGRLRTSFGEDGRAEDEAELRTGLRGIAGLDLPGLVATAVGQDLDLREGGWDFAITNDWVDPDAYRSYDQDPEHNRYRQIIVAVCREVARVQFEVPDGQESS